MYVHVCVCMCVCVCVCARVCVHMCVTGFEKSLLPCTQQQDTLFTINDSCTSQLTIRGGICTKSCPNYFF